MIRSKGYTLIELMIAVGLFAVVMLMASGAYIMMIGLSRQAQGIATGIDNLSFALETMTRTIRTGHGYSCGGALNLGDCNDGRNTFTFVDESSRTTSYSLSSGAIQRQVSAGAWSPLTDSSSIRIDSLKFYVFGSGPVAVDRQQSHATIIITGTVLGEKTPQSFTIETGATMRGSDI
ncbi:MAG: prepilin-type N-terminal cleavage/methylation domain-containing protein [Candidatus Kaiserbacteria bacterium]|nr:prepilin-type N-terminal cleavage/methylation domain-containing protein [Candidatus Kaiserbacteria bacterium]